MKDPLSPEAQAQRRRLELLAEARRVRRPEPGRVVIDLSSSRFTLDDIAQHAADLIRIGREIPPGPVPVDAGLDPVDDLD